MAVLQDHQKRVASLRDSLERLLSLHQRVHDLHNETLALAATRTPGYEARIEEIREQARSLHDEIALLRGSLGLPDDAE